MPSKDGNNRNLTLEEKENRAQQIIKRGLDDARNPYILFDGRIESLVLLHMLRQVCEGKMLAPVLHIDTTVEFEDIYQYIEKMRKLWGFKLIRERNEMALKAIKFADDREKCCSVLKTNPMENAIKKYNIDKLFVFEDIKIDIELFKSHDEHLIVYPIKHFCPKDFWDYINKYNLSYCSLYDRGYNNIRCSPCTDAPEPKDMHKGKKEEEIKKRLKALGYM